MPARSEAMQAELSSIRLRVEKESRVWSKKEMVLKNNLRKAEAEVRQTFVVLLEGVRSDSRRKEFVTISGYQYFLRLKNRNIKCTDFNNITTIRMTFLEVLSGCGTTICI